MHFIADRIASLLIGALLGLFIAIGLLVWVSDIDQWWILIVVPAACAGVSALVGDRAIEILKHVAGFPQ